MSGYTWVETKASAVADSTAVTNTVTPASIIHSTAKPVIAAQEMVKAGQVFRVTVTGRISTVVTTPGTLTLDCRLGSAVVFNGGAMALNVNAQTNATFKFIFHLRLVTLGSGATATVIGTGQFISRAVIGAAAVGVGGAGALMLPDTAPVVGTGFDSTIAQTVDVFATWSIANAANSILSHIAFIELVN